MTVKEIAEQANVPRWKVYYVRDRIGKVPTVEEVINYHGKKGRPIKYELKECEKEIKLTKKEAKRQADIDAIVELLRVDLFMLEFEYLFLPNCTDERKVAMWLYDNGWRHLKSADEISKKGIKIKELPNGEKYHTLSGKNDLIGKENDNDTSN